MIDDFVIDLGQLTRILGDARQYSKRMLSDGLKRIHSALKNKIRHKRYNGTTDAIRSHLYELQPVTLGQQMINPVITVTIDRWTSVRCHMRVRKGSNIRRV